MPRGDSDTKETKNEAPAEYEPTLRDTAGERFRDKGLKHSQGGSTTRDDGADLGVPMLPGSPDEPVGPEDALGPGPKRGDYSNRVGDGFYNPHQMVRDEDGVVHPVAQRERAENRGEAKGLKGGVDTTDETKATKGGGE